MRHVSEKSIFLLRFCVARIFQQNCVCNDITLLYTFYTWERWLRLKTHWSKNHRMQSNFSQITSTRPTVEMKTFEIDHNTFCTALLCFSERSHCFLLTAQMIILSRSLSPCVRHRKSAHRPWYKHRRYCITHNNSRTNQKITTWREVNTTFQYNISYTYHATDHMIASVVNLRTDGACSCKIYIRICLFIYYF